MLPQPIDFLSGVEPSECPILAGFDTEWRVRQPNILWVDDHGE